VVNTRALLRAARNWPRGARNLFIVALGVLLGLGSVAFSPAKAHAAIPEVRTSFSPGIDLSAPLAASGSAMVFGTHRSTNAGATWATDPSLVPVRATAWLAYGSGQLIGTTATDSGGVTTRSAVVYTLADGTSHTYSLPSQPSSVGGSWMLSAGSGQTVPAYNFVDKSSATVTSPSGTLMSGPYAQLSPGGGVVWSAQTVDSHPVFAYADSPSSAAGAWATVDGIVGGFWGNGYVVTASELRYAFDAGTGLQFCRRPLTNLAAAATCVDAWPGASTGYSYSSATLNDFGSSTIIKLTRYTSTANESRTLLWNGTSVVPVQLPSGSVFSRTIGSEVVFGETPYVVIRDGLGVPSVHKVNSDGSLATAFTLPNSPTSPTFLAVTPDRVVGADGRYVGVEDGSGGYRSDQFAVWSRAVSATSFGAETVLPRRASGLAASAGRTAVQGPDGLSMYNRGQLGYTFADGDLSALSGPYVAQNVRDAAGNVVSERLSTVNGNQVASFATQGALFGSRYVTYSSAAGVMTVTANDLTGKPAHTANLTVGAQRECYNVQVWNDRVAMTCYDSADSKMYLVVFDLTSGALVKSDTGKWLQDLGDGYVTVGTYDSATQSNVYQIEALAGGAPVTLADCSDGVLSDGVGHVLCTSSTQLIWRDYSSLSTSAPRLLGVLAPAAVDFSSTPAWVPDFDTTKALNAGTLVIKNAAGVVVRNLATAASPDGSVRGLSWDGKDASGKSVPAGTYSFTLNAAASDGTGTVLSIDGAGAVTGSVTVAGNSVSYDQFVKAAYQDFLGRAPSASELAAKTGPLAAGTLSKQAFLSTMANSDEWLNAIVTKMYADTLGRAPDAAGLAGWTALIRNKTFSVADVASRFYASDEYYLYHAGGTPTLWVTALYQKLLNRAPDAAGLSAWVAATNSPAWGRPKVAFEFYQSLESRLKRVDALYQVLLGRGPDPVGWPFWANTVLSTGDITLAVSLADSEEYWLRAQARF
jgi:hypothetical protein